MRFVFIDAEKVFYPVVVLCRVMQVGRSGFYAWQRRAPSARARTDQVLQTHIARAFGDSRGTYGSPRIRAQLNAQGVSVSKRRVTRLMHSGGLYALRKRRFVRTTDSAHKRPIAPNLLHRDFTAAAPNRVWVTDITCVWTRQGWLYLAAMLDLFSRRVVGWAMSEHIDEKLVLAALNHLRSVRLDELASGKAGAAKRWPKARPLHSLPESPAAAARQWLAELP